MTDKIRCPACRGAKKVPKLGGMIGDCNTCEATGKINACDKPVAVEHVATNTVTSLIEQVSDCVPVPVEPVVKAEAIKVDGKRAIYKRKKA